MQRNISKKPIIILGSVLTLLIVVTIIYGVSSAKNKELKLEQLIDTSYEVLDVRRHKKEKTYEAVLRLGIETNTQDMTGTILNEKEVSVSEDDLTKVIRSFLGEQQQIPPMYSALKVNGKKIIRTCQRRQNCRT